MKQKPISAINDGTPNMILWPKSNEATSLLQKLTPDEQRAMNEWSAAQEGDPERGGAIDMMRWPGWKDVLARQFLEMFGKLPEPYIEYDEYHKANPK